MKTEWKLVPVEPTDEMLSAAADVPEDWPQQHWEAMLAAAPVPPAGGEVEVLDSFGSRIEGDIEVFNVHIGEGQSAALVDRAHVTPLQADKHTNLEYIGKLEQALNAASTERDALKAEVERLNQHSKELQNDKSSNSFNHAGSSFRGFVTDSSLLDVLKLQDVANTYIREGDVSGALAEVAAIIGHISELQSELTKARELLVSAETWMPEDGKVLADIQSFLAHQSTPAAKRAKL